MFQNAVTTEMKNNLGMSHRFIVIFLIKINQQPSFTKEYFLFG
jgi:hypothetical protein